MRTYKQVYWISRWYYWSKIKQRGKRVVFSKTNNGDRLTYQMFPKGDFYLYLEVFLSPKVNHLN